MDGSGNFSFCQLDSTGDPKQLDSPKFGSGTKDFKDNVEDFNSGQVLLEVSEKCDSHPQEVINSVPLKTKSFGLKETDEMRSSISDKLQSDAKTSTKNKQGQRAKVPFEKGFSQMDWLMLTRTHPDLAGLKGQSNRRLITMDEVKQQTAGGSIWTVLQGRVYNISPYMKYHPGGDEMLMKAAGKDCTSLFSILTVIPIHGNIDKYHAWVNADLLLEKCLVGFLDVN